MQPAKPMSQGLRSALDLGPLIVFFVAYFVAKKIYGPAPPGELPAGTMWATILFMIATLLSLVTTFAIERKVHPIPLITGAVVLVFGGLTLALHDERFIKLKPTIVYLIFAAALFVGLRMRRLFIRHLLGHVLHLNEAGWRQLTIRWGIFFIVAAILNEIVWRNFSTEIWITFKVWGFTLLTLAFAVWQAFAVAKYQIKPEQVQEQASQ